MTASNLHREAKCHPKFQIKYKEENAVVWPNSSNFVSLLFSFTTLTFHLGNQHLEGKEGRKAREGGKTEQEEKVILDTISVEASGIPAGRILNLDGAWVMLRWGWEDEPLLPSHGSAVTCRPSHQPWEKWLSAPEAIPLWDWQLSWGLSAGSTPPAGGVKSFPGITASTTVPFQAVGVPLPCPYYAYKNPTLNGQDWEIGTIINLKEA